MNAYSLGLYEKSMPNNLTLKEKLAETRNAGFDFMEISIDESGEKLERLKWGRQERLEILHAVCETGIRILTMCLSGHRKLPIGSEDKTSRNMGMELMADAIDFAADIGVRVIQIAGYDEYYRPSNENTKMLFLQNLITSADIASKKGVILAFETMETEFMNTVEKAMYYVSLVNSPYLQVYPDLGNITNAALQYGHIVTDDLKAGRGHLAAMHLKETVPGKFREIPYGMGNVDFDTGIRTASELGVNLFVGEFWHTGNKDWKQQLKLANTFLRDKLIKNHVKG